MEGKREKEGAEEVQNMVQLERGDSFSETKQEGSDNATDEVKNFVQLDRDGRATGDEYSNQFANKESTEDTEVVNMVQLERGDNDHTKQEAKSSEAEDADNGTDEIGNIVPLQRGDEVQQDEGEQESEAVENMVQLERGDEPDSNSNDKVDKNIDTVESIVQLDRDGRAGSSGINTFTNEKKSEEGTAEVDNVLKLERGSRTKREESQKEDDELDRDGGAGDESKKGGNDSVKNTEVENVVQLERRDEISQRDSDENNNEVKMKNEIEVGDNNDDADEAKSIVQLEAEEVNNGSNSLGNSETEENTAEIVNMVQLERGDTTDEKIKHESSNDSGASNEITDMVQLERDDNRSDEKVDAAGKEENAQHESDDAVLQLEQKLAQLEQEAHENVEEINDDEREVESNNNNNKNKNNDHTGNDDTKDEEEDDNNGYTSNNGDDERKSAGDDSEFLGASDINKSQATEREPIPPQPSPHTAINRNEPSTTAITSVPSTPDSTDEDARHVSWNPDAELANMHSGMQNNRVTLSFKDREQRQVCGIPRDLGTTQFAQAIVRRLTQREGHAYSMNHERVLWIIGDVNKNTHSGAAQGILKAVLHTGCLLVQSCEAAPNLFANSFTRAADDRTVCVLPQVVESNRVTHALHVVLEGEKREYKIHAQKTTQFVHNLAGKDNRIVMVVLDATCKTLMAQIMEGARRGWPVLALGDNEAAGGSVLEITGDLNGGRAAQFPLGMDRGAELASWLHLHLTMDLFALGAA